MKNSEINFLDFLYILWILSDTPEKTKFTTYLLVFL